MINVTDFNLELLKKQQEIYKKFINYKDDILKVFIKWNNKKITKRIENDLKKIDTGIFFKKSYNWYDLKFYCNDNTITINDRNCYVKNDTLYYISYNKDIINYDEIKQNIEQNVNYYIEKIEKQNIQIKKIEKLVKHYNKIKQLKEKIRDEITILRDCFIGYDDEL